jgi:hypothetical protein
LDGLLIGEPHWCAGGLRSRVRNAWGGCVVAIEIVLDDALNKVRGTVAAILEVRQRFGKHDQGFLDVYPTARNERTALGTSEFLMCLLLPMDAVVGTRHEQEFSLDGLLSSEELKQLILDDIKYVITEITRDRRNPGAQAAPLFDVEAPYLDGKPYAYTEKGIQKKVTFSESIDAASFYLASFVLLKKHLKPLLTTRWEGHTLLDWVEQVIVFCHRFLKSKIYDGWAFFEAGTSERSDERSLLFFTWTATEAITTAAEAGEREAQELLNQVLIPKTLPEIHKRLDAFSYKSPGETQEALSLLYTMTHLVIIASLLRSEATQGLEKMIKASSEYWDHLKNDLLADKEGELSNIYHFREFMIVDIGIYPLYLRSLFLALQNPNLSTDAIGDVEQELTSAYYDLLNMYPRPQTGESVQSPLADFTKWNLLGSNAKGGVHFIFLTERVIEAYSSVILHLLPQQPLEDEAMTLQMTFQAGAFRRLFSGMINTLRQELKEEIEKGIERRLERFRMDLLKEIPQSKKTGLAIGPPTAEQTNTFKDLLAGAKVLLNPKLAELASPTRMPPSEKIEAMRAKVEEWTAANFSHQLDMQKAIDELQQFQSMWDEGTVDFARKRPQGKDRKKEA